MFETMHQRMTHGGVTAKFIYSFLGRCCATAILLCCGMTVGEGELSSQNLTLPREQRPEWLRKEGLVMGGNWFALPFRTKVGTSTGTATTAEERAAWEREHTPEVTEEMKALGVNFIMMHCYHGAGMEVERESMQDAVRFAKQYHDAGLHVGVYVYSGAFLWEPLYREIPEAQNWALLDKNDKPFDYYNLGIRYYWNRNHPGAEAFYKKIIEFAVKDIQADLLHFDNHSKAAGRDAWSVMQFREFLRKNFSYKQLQQMGAADLSQVMPPVGSPGPAPSYSVSIMDEPPRNLFDYAWLEFATRALAASYKEESRYARSLRSDILIELNGGRPGNTLRAPVDPGRLLQGGEAVWSEGNVSGYVDGRYQTRIRSYKVARCLGNLVFFYADTPLSMAESMAFNYDCLGMICEFRFGGDVVAPRPPLRPVSEENRPFINFYRTRRTLFRDAEVVADIAVLRSFPSQVFADSRHSELTSEVEQYCIDERIPFQIVHDTQLENLDQYPVLVLAGCVALTDVQIQHILRYVDRGGRLCVIGPVATHNEWMVPREGAPLHSLPEDRIIKTDSEAHIGDVLRQSVGGQFSAGITGSEGVFVEYTMTPEGRLVHLVNFRPEIPARNVQVNVRIPEGRKVKRVLLASPDQKIDQPVKFTKKGDRIFFAVPEVVTYTVAIVEM